MIDAIGGGNHSPIVSKTVIEKMLDEGLIVELPARIDRAGGLPIRIREFDLPIAVHMDWCVWCSENSSDEPPD